MRGEYLNLRRALLASTGLAVVALAVAAGRPARAQDATWLASPGTGDFTTAANWTSGTVPTGTAFFGTSSKTALSFLGDTTVGGWTFNAGASNYSFSNSQFVNFTGAGIVINGGSAAITNTSSSTRFGFGRLIFDNTSTAGSATITNSDGSVYFNNGSTAGSAAITNNNSGYVSFNNTSTAGSAAITNNSGGSLYFHNTSTAGSATITTNSGGASWIFDSASGGIARFILNGTGVLDISFLTTGGTTAGSIEGAGSVFLGSKNLAVGGNNLSTTFSGVIRDGSFADGGGGTGGSLTKTGSGTLTLAGVNTYTGGTTINAGTLRAGVAGAFVGNTAYAVNGGTLDLNGLNLTMSSLSGTGGTVALGAAALTIDQATGTSYAGAVTGTGSLTKTGGGTLTLSGVNTYSGGTTFAGGTVSVSSDANLGDVAGGLTFNGGTLQITGTAFHTTARAVVMGAGSGTFDIANAANFFTVNQGLTGTGGLTKTGAGTLWLRGTNTYTGATTVSAGTLIIQNSIASSVVTNNATLFYTTNSTAGNAVITNNGQLTFDTDARAGNAIITNSGTVLFDGDSTPENAQLINTASTAVINFFTPGPNRDGRISAGSIAGNGRFDLGGIELTVGGNNLSTTVTGALAGDGRVTGTSLIKVGTGTLTLSGINTYTGATTVDDGTLIVNGSIASSSSLTLNSGTVLGGTGIVGNTTIAGGATLLGGNGTAGTSLAVSGNLAFQSGAYYLVQVNPATASSVNVTGTAALGGATVNAVFAPGSYVAKQYTILTAGNVSGKFGSLVDTNLPSNFHSELSYDGTHAYLNLILNFVAPPGSGLSGNQQKVGDAIIGSFNRNGGISLVYSGLTSAGLTQASGETAAGSQQTTFQAMGQFMGLLTDPSGAGREGGTTAPPAYADSAPAAAARDAYAMLTKAPTFEQRWSVWASGFGGSQTTDGNTAQGSNSATSRLFGTAAGAEYAFSPQTLAGFALAGGGTSFSVTGGGTGRSDLFQAGAYVRHTSGPSYVSAALAFGWQDVTTDRTVTLAGIDHLRAEFNANTWSGRVEGGYRFIAPWIGGVGLTPYAAGQFTRFDLPAYAESVVSGSNAFALSYAAKSVTDTRSELGLRTDKSFAMADGVLTLRGRAAWAHDFNPDHSVAATFQALPGASFVVNGAQAAGNSALTTASAEMKWLNGWAAAASFEGEFSNVTRSYAGKGTVRYEW